ncbi:protein Aster-B-like isoform X4 [Ptychodera flava]|uniref:protein Aster-B-like isoform X4 n=1 Tax=Ptychodera flava TaxID=63121 RepID=UPI00396AAA1A
MTTHSQKTLLDLVKEKDRDTDTSDPNTNEDVHPGQEDDKHNELSVVREQPNTIVTMPADDEQPRPPTSSKQDLPTMHEESELDSSFSMDESTSGQAGARMTPDPSKDSLSRSSDDITSLERSTEKTSSGERTPEMSSHKTDKSKTNKKSSNSSWYNVWTPSYKSKCEDFRRIFGKSVPDSERLVVDYSCALQKDILVHGRLYLTQNWVCFYANIFRWETCITIKCREITAITKEKTARVIPNAIQICTDTEKYFFTSFGSRDKSFMILFRLWQNALLDQPMQPQDFWAWVKMNYGDEAAVESDDTEFTLLDVKEEDSENIMEINSGKKAQRVVSPLALSDRYDTSPESPSSNTVDSMQESSLLQSPAYAADESSLNTESDLSFNNKQDDTSHAKSPVIESKPKPSDRSARTPSTPSPIKTDQPEIPDDTNVIPGSEEVPTDESDFTEGEEYIYGCDGLSPSEYTDVDTKTGEVVCPCREHPGRKCINEVYDFSAAKLFEMLFSDTNTFYREFLESRKTMNIVMFPWQDNKNKMVRNMTYTLTLFASFGPKTSESSEVQTYLKDLSKDGQCYVIETEVVNHGIPYGDNFYVSNKYCITRVSSTQSRLRITCEIRYKKSVWGLVKTIIEKNAGAGIQDNYRMLDEHLAKASLSTNARFKRKKTSTAMRRRKHSQNRVTADVMDEKTAMSNDYQTSTPITSPHISSAKGSPLQRSLPREPMLELFGLRLETKKFMVLIVVILMVLLLFNLVLFYRLKSLELAANQMSPWKLENAINSFSNIPKTSQDWSDLLKQQQYYHDTELERWREILAISIQLLDQMKGTLVELKKDIRTSGERTFSSKDEM